MFLLPSTLFLHDKTHKLIHDLQIVFQTIMALCSSTGGLYMINAAGNLQRPDKHLMHFRSKQTCLKSHTHGNAMKRGDDPTGVRVLSPRCQQTGSAPLRFVTHTDPLCLPLSLTLSSPLDTKRLFVSSLLLSDTLKRCWMF